MQQKGKIIFTVSIIVVIVSAIAIPILVVYLPKEEGLPSNIIIRNDSDFDLYEFPGNGSKENPYLIENRTIRTTNHAHAICIKDTTRYFMIRNCFLQALLTCIHIENVANGTAIITQNNCKFGSYSGITLEESPSAIVTRNYCAHSQYGFSINSSSDSLFIDNFCEEIESGIYISESYNSTIQDNTCINSDNGISLFYSNSSRINGNNCTNEYSGYSGINIANSDNLYLKNNTNVKFDYGIKIADCENVTSIQNSILENGQGIYQIDCLNCSVISNNCYRNNAGIRIYNSNYTAIMNNTCYPSSYYSSLGIVISISPYTILIGNNCSGTSGGIRLEPYSSNSIVSMNICNNSGTSFSINRSLNCTVTNNTFTKSNIGILDVYSDVILINNTITDHTFGIMATSSDMTIINNSFTNCGIYLGNHYESQNIGTNWVNNKELGYFVNETNLVIDEQKYGQLILVNCSNSYVMNQNLSNASVGLTLCYSRNVTLTDNLCNNNSYGIYVKESNSTKIENITCKNIIQHGMYIIDSINSTLLNNFCFNIAKKGILVQYSTNSIIVNNFCEYCSEDGIRIDYSTETLIVNNTCNASYYGIVLYYANTISVINNTYIDNWAGIRLYHADEGYFMNNTFYMNRYGIYSYNSEFCEIFYNLFEYNENYAIIMSIDSNNNIIHHNSFINNNLGGDSQALDHGSNIWFDDILYEGNYWSDWSGIGYYYLNGDSNAYDPFPLTSPPV